MKASLVQLAWILGLTLGQATAGELPIKDQSPLNHQTDNEPARKILPMVILNTLEKVSDVLLTEPRNAPQNPLSENLAGSYSNNTPIVLGKVSFYRSSAIILLDSRTSFVVSRRPTTWQNYTWGIRNEKRDTEIGLSYKGNDHTTIFNLWKDATWGARVWVKWEIPLGK